MASSFGTNAGTFRESVMVSGGPARSSAALPAAEAPLALEPFATSEFRSARSGELRRVLGVSVEDHSKPSIPPIAWEELKRFRVSVQESSSRARDRAKLLQEFILKLDKYRNSVSRKRQKNESQSSEKVNGSNLLKTGGHMHQTTSDLLSHRLEDRTKNAVPKRRVRSSMTELRASSSYSLQSEGKNTVPVKQGAMTDKDNSFVLVDKDNNMIRANNAGPIPSEEKMRALPAGGDGWEKKLKRKRSVGTMVARTADGDRELKPELQQRSHNEPRHRSSDGLGFRTGSSNVIFGSTRVDGNSQPTGVSSRVILRNDSDSNSLLNERRERTGGLDKERVISKGTNKLNLREDAQLGSQSLTKGNASRAPRTGSAVVMNTLSFPRSSGTIDEWEQPSSLNKAQPLTGAINRKRPLPTGSSSPPVQWASQRPLKISRSRRANVVSPVSNLDEAQALSEGLVPPDVGARLASMENSGILLSRGTVNSSHQIKLKFENVRSPLGSSDSEASGVPESKSKEKEIDNVEIEDGTLKATPKAASCFLPTKKNKPPTKEEIRDGVRRQGRSGRGSMQSKACLPITKQKMENVETTKPVKSGKPVSDKTESRIGRPPSKKVSDCKGSRPGQITHSGSLDLSVEPEDDQKELLAAATGARAASAARGATSDTAAQVARAAISVASKSCSGFWKQMEPVFACITSEDLAHVKHQIHFAEELDGGSCDMVDTDQSEMGEATCQVVPSSDIGHTSSHINVVGLKKSVVTPCSVNESELPKMASVELESETWFEKVIPLSQRLLSAFITEDEVRMFDSIKQGDAVLEVSSVSSPYATNSDARNELNPEYAMDHDLKSRTNCFGENSPCYGCATPNSFRSPNNSISCDEMLPKYDVLIQSDARDDLGLGQPNLNMREALAADSSGSPSYECQFEHMPLDDRILMELHSIGIYPDTMPDLAEGDVEEIEKVISELKIKLYQEVQKKKSQLSKLEGAIEEGKEHERRKLEQLAMEILVETAYKRQLCGRGGSSHKSGASKVSKQLALAFAKRTLARYRVFEKTGQSCFSEPVLHDHLFSEPLHSSDAKESDDTKFGTAANMYAELRNGPLTSRVSASGAMTSGLSSNMIERHAPRHKIERGSLVPIQGEGEQTFAKSDSVSNRGKKREVLLDEIVTNARVIPTLSDTLSGCAKWKETDKDKDVDTLSRHSVKRAAHPSLSASRGERKTKAKPKQNISQLPTSGNGAARVTETTTFLFPSARDSCETVNSGSTKVLELDLPSSRISSQGLSKEMEDNVITHLPLQGIDTIDELDVADGLGGQGQDIASWLNVDEDALEDQDLICLQIPMDDLADLNLI